MATVLVVDDEPDIVLLARVALELHGHTVRTAGSGEEALSSLRQGRPDVMVLDVMMPELDGWGVLAQLKAAPDEHMREIPVIFLTALAGSVDRARGGIEGAVRYLTKPFDPDHLARTVAEVLAGKPEPVQRREAQHRALELLARLETSPTGAPAGPGFRLSGLERAPDSDMRRDRGGGVDVAAVLSRLDLLTSVQRRTLQVLHHAETVQAAAGILGVSRSNIYASLRRIARRLEVDSAQELLELVRGDPGFAEP